MNKCPKCNFEYKTGETECQRCGIIFEKYLALQKKQITKKQSLRLRPNEIAEWELRIGNFRVFYNVEKAFLIVTIEAVGFKVGNVLFIRDKERKL